MQRLHLAFKNLANAHGLVGELLELEEFPKACKTTRRSIRNRLTLLEEKKLLEE